MAHVRRTSVEREDFYSLLPVLNHFEEICDASHYRPLPADWYVVLTDVKQSTAAVEQGRYKEVNFLGAASISAVLNAVRPVDVPYVFGGDGATLCVPGSCLCAVREALAGLKHLAWDNFGLSLRAGVVPVGDIINAGHQVLVARYHAHNDYHQAVFMGGGLSYAERLVKTPGEEGRYEIEASERQDAVDLSGLECRWQDVESERGEVVSLLVMALAGSDADKANLYRKIIRAVSEVYGEADVCRPIREAGLHLLLSGPGPTAEAHAKSFGRSWAGGMMQRLEIGFRTLLGYLFMGRGWRVGDTDWGRYKADVAASTDFRKFDDMLRMVIAGTPTQRTELSELLEALYRSGDLVYGIHASPKAHVTCLVFDRDTHHVHFVDATGGGYTLAAREMKRRLRDASQREGAS